MAQNSAPQQPKSSVSNSPYQPSALGRGLSSLISSDSLNMSSRGYIPSLPIEHLSANPHQPRMSIKPEELISIADSIRENGIIQPLIVTKRGERDYVLIAGERRWRAAQLAGLKTVPVVVREASAQQMLEFAVIENVQRKDLNPIEEALAFDQLARKFNLQHKAIAQKVGLSRVAVVNKIRLLKLPDTIKQLVLDNVLSEGHARALLGIKDPDSMIAAAHMVVKRNMNVHEAEDLARKVEQGLTSSIAKNIGRPRRLPPRILEIENNLSTYFNRPLTIMKMNKGGKITLRYKTDEELEDIYRKITE
jgi:ParB family transcriptional regulator, chromosome partitioning protein